MAVKSPTKIKLIKKWLKTLRSGKYAQTKEGFLREVQEDGQVMGHCCLGVLCDIVDPKGWGKNANASHKFSKIGELGTSKSTGMISKTFAKRVGLTPSNCVTLAEMNDGKYGFAELADTISRMTGVNG